MATNNLSRRKGILIRRPEHLCVSSDYKCSRGILIRRPATTSTAELQQALQVGGALTRAQAKRAKLEDNQVSDDAKAQAHNDAEADPAGGEDDDPGYEHDDQLPAGDEDDIEPAGDQDDVEPAGDERDEDRQAHGEEHQELKTDNNDFDHDTIVVENSDLTGHIHRAFHRHQKIFQSEDHLYKFYFSPKTKSPILWSSIEDILLQALDAIIKHLQQKYRGDPDCIIYFTINQNNLVTGLRSSPHVLKHNTVFNMVQNVLSTFHRFVNSNQNVELNDTFEVYFKVLSGLHVNWPAHRRKAIPLRTVVGTPSETPDKTFQPGGLIDLYMLKPISDSFPNMCLIVTLLYLFFRTVQINIFDQVSSLTKPISKRSKRVVETGLATFRQYISEFCNATQISEQGPHDLHLVASAFSTYYKCQIVLISSMDGSVPTYSLYPSVLTLSLPRLYCFIRDNHILGVLNLTAFFRFHKKTICFMCKHFQYFWNTRRQHKCLNVPTCCLCHGIIKQALFSAQSHENLVFCDSELNKGLEPKITCQICQNQFETKLCFDNHFYRCKNREMPYFCNLCHTFVPTNKQRVCDVKRAHVCGETILRCKTCFQQTTDNHSCEVVKTNQCKNWPIMSTVTMFFLSNQQSDNCNDCYLLKIKYALENKITLEEAIKRPDLLCPRHANASPHHLKANAISLWFETQRFMFCQKTFLDDELTEMPVTTASREKVTIFHYCNNPKPYSTTVISKHLKGVSKNLRAATNKVFKTAEEKFFQFLINECTNVTFLVENDVTMFKLLDICLSFEMQPNILQKGSRVYSLDLTPIGVKFINFINYIPGRLEDWTQQFGIEALVPYFPQKLNTLKNMQSKSCGPLQFNDWIEFGDGSTIVAQKQSFFDTIDQSLTFKQLLYQTLLSRSELFFNVVIRYLKESLNLQVLISKEANKCNDFNALHPFQGYIISCSSYIMSLCKYFYLDDFKLCTVPSPYNSLPCTVSQGEYEYTSYMAWAKPELNIKNAFTAVNNELRFGHITVDGYSDVNKTVYDYRGDWTHCHDSKECSNPNRKERNLAFCQLKRQQDAKTVQTLKTRFASKVQEVLTIWECAWLSFKTENKEAMERFWAETGLPKKRPMVRLTPRASVRGGFVETYKLKYVASETHKISWVDANSLYSFIALNCNLPIGGFKTLTFFDLKGAISLNKQNGQFYYKGESMIADIAMVEILAPSFLRRPFLSYRIKDQFVFMANCRTCAELKLTKPCKHNDSQRSFTSVWTVAEIAYAVKKLGYTIRQWLEVHHYSESKPILADFVKILASQKLKNSNIYEDCSTMSERQQYCDMLNDKMGFQNDNVKLDLSGRNNPLTKNYFKLALNSLYGRFALHNENVKHVFVKSIYELQAIASNANNDIVSFNSINDNILEVTYINKTTIRGNRYSNMYFTSLINAHARIFIYDLSETLANSGCEILSIDTDAILFAHLKTFVPPISLSHCFGDFKPVLNKDCHIESYYSLGCRSYIVNYIDENGYPKYITKIKGLSLTSLNNSEMVTPNVFATFIEKRFQNEVDKLFIPQSRKRFEPQTRTFSNIIRTHAFSNEIHVKRFLIPGDVTYDTFPYGYDFKNMSKQ